MDELDRRLIMTLQEGFPLTPRPFLSLAEALSLSEADVLARIKNLVDSGIIRRFGPVFDSRALGLATVLCAVKVSPEYLSYVAEKINSFPGVTHNYRREGEYDLWFTITAKDEEEVERQLAAIRSLEGVGELIELPARRVFKLEVCFRV